MDRDREMGALGSVQKLIPILLEGIWLAGEARRRSIALTSVTEEQSRGRGTSEPKPPSPPGRGGTGPSAWFLGRSSISGDTLPPPGLASGPVALPPKPEVVFAQTLTAVTANRVASSVSSANPLPARKPAHSWARTTISALSPPPGAWGAQAGISVSSSPGRVIERNLILGNREGFNFREQTRTTQTLRGAQSRSAYQTFSRSGIDGLSATLLQPLATSDPQMTVVRMSVQTRSRNSS